MARLKLVISNKNVSSWSMRPWLLMIEAGIPFDEEMIPFGAPQWQSRVGSPSGRVPLLVAGELRIWDSLAIAEYLNEQFPEKQLWPADVAARATARSASSEMHSGFADLRRECSMNLGARFDKEPSAKCAADVRRIDALFADCRARFGGGGEFLFGKFSIADAMFAPVAGRVRTYNLKLSEVSQRYADALLAMPSFQRWDEEARAEVAAGIVDPVSHGALFTRAEAEQVAQRWIDGLNAKHSDSLAALCSDPARGVAIWQREQAAGPHKLTSCAWDGDVNRLAISLSHGAKKRVEILAFDSASRVAEIESFG